MFSFFFQAEDGIRDTSVTGVQTCALPIFSPEPNALVLLNPAFGCPPGQSSQGAPCAVMASWKVTKGGPPAILFYGTEDPLQDAGRDFALQLIGAGTRAEFFTAAGQQHGFFNRFPDSPWHALV